MVSRRGGLVRILPLALVVAACGSGPPASTAPDSSGPTSSGSTSSAPTATGSASSAPPTSATIPSGPTAAADLFGFFTEAGRLDADLRTAARMVNSGIGPDALRIDTGTKNAVRSIDRTTLARTIPAGLDDNLLRAVLLVHNDVATRRAALNRVVEYAGQTLPRSGREAKDLILCLGNGSEPAARFAADLAAARALAVTSSPPPEIGPGSREAAEVAVRVAGIDVGNFGCDSCGAPVKRPVPLPAITWKHTVLAPGSEWDGTVGTSYFRAVYTAGVGWDVGLDVC